MLLQRFWGNSDVTTFVRTATLIKQRTVSWSPSFSLAHHTKLHNAHHSLTPINCSQHHFGSTTNFNTTKVNNLNTTINQFLTTSHQLPSVASCVWPLLFTKDTNQLMQLRSTTIALLREGHH